MPPVQQTLFIARINRQLELNVLTLKVKPCLVVYVFAGSRHKSLVWCVAF